MIKPNLTINAPVSSRSEYGDRSRDLIRSLMGMDKYDIKILDQPLGNHARNAFPEEFLSMMIPNLTAQPDVWIQVTPYNNYQRVGKYNIGVTATAGTDRPSPEFLEGVNRMDLVIVPSEHTRNSFASVVYQAKDNRTQQITGELKLTTKLEVLFEGLDLTIFNKTGKSCESINSHLNSIPEKNCHLIVGDWENGEFGHDRKDLGGTIRTFLETFKNKSAKNQPALVVKTSKASYSLTDREDMLDRIRQIRSSIETTGTVSNVYLLHGELSSEEMNDLYHHPKIKSMISFTHEETFGRSLLEFGITGKPIIAPNWSGHLDFLSEYGLLLQGNLQPVHASALKGKSIIEGSNWYYPDYGYAMGLIKDVDSNYKKHLVKSRKQKQYIKDNFTMDKMTERLATIVEDNIPSFKIETPKLEDLQTYE
jgi:hypothetical protein